MSGQAPPVLRVENVSKNFAGVAALSDVSLEIHAGEIVGVVGDNGAGKSTLVKTISGEHLPSSGLLQIDGQPVEFTSPAAARALGIETIYQDLGLVDHMDAAQNFFLGREVTYGGALRPLRILRRSAMRSRARQAVEELHVRIPEIATRPVARMSGGQRQAVAIARGVFWGQKLMLLDEPTAALGVRESREAIQMISRLKERGIPMLVVSHNLVHVWEICDRVVVLRLGRKVADLRTSDTSPDQVIAYMTGVAA
jgi:ABC-type sugar transport system ATPase subunit